jgi:hypothetical protein
MHRRLSFPAVLAAAVVCAAALSGCTAPSAESDPAVASETAPETQTTTETPFTPYWNAMYGVYDAPDQIAERREVEALVASCMAAEGFDYVQVDQGTPEQVTGYMDGYGTAEWVAEHGYGAFPTDDETAQMDMQVASEDPNGQYVASLSDGEAGAYYEALNGPPAGLDARTGAKEEVPNYNWETAGCLGRAQHEVLGDDPTRSAQFEPLVAAMNALEQDQLGDPAMAPIDAEWSDCMAAAGFSGLPTKQSAVDAVFAQASEYWATGATDEPAEDVRAEWREYEVRVAVADFDCAESVGFSAKATAVQVARETQFIADNLSQLDELLAELAQGE